MFGIGFQEMLLVGLLFLVLFGPKRLPEMASDLGRFVSKAQHVVDELKAELVSGVEDDRKPQRSSGTQEAGQKLAKKQESSLRS